MKRSTFLKIAGATVLGSAAAGTVALGSKDYVRKDFKNEKAGWKNWSELQQCNPATIASPKTDEALIEAMKKAKTIRFAGTGHSFMPLVPTNQTIISLDAMSGIINTNDENLTATVKAGSKLAYLAREFNGKGQEFMNLPDINTQTLAGATSTATHGTGKDFKAIHAYFKAMRLITPEGEVITCSEEENPDIFQAAKVAIGSLGAITEITLQNRPAYNLHRVVYIQTLDWSLENALELIDKHDHFEMFYFPSSDRCAIITHDVHTGQLNPRLYTDDEDGLKDLKLIRNYLYWTPRFRKKIMQQLLKPGDVVEDYSDEAWRLLSQPRVSKFNESEYHLPIENGLACFKKVCAMMDLRKDSFFPIEFRVIKGDDAWLSPFYQRDSISIAIHVDYKETYKYLVKDFGPVFRSFNGRPHWGKLNDFTKEEFQKAYPKWEDFLAVRQRCDPNGKLMNDYLQKIFS